MTRRILIGTLVGLAMGCGVPGVNSDGSYASHSKQALVGDVVTLDIESGTGSSYPSGFAATEDDVFFAASRSDGHNLWKSDGTSVGTHPFLLAGWTDSPMQLTASGSSLFFTDYQSNTGTEMWVADQSAGEFGFPTLLTPEMTPGSDSTPVGEVLPLNGGIVFTAAPNMARTWALYQADGTGAWSRLGTPLDVRNLSLIDGFIYFAGADTNGLEVWRTDGTTGGTKEVADINTGTNSSAPSDFVKFGSEIFFVADDGTHGREIWSLDPVSLSVSMLTDLVSGSGSPFTDADFPAQLTVAGNRLFFVANTASLGTELWMTDGTSSGTVLVGDLAGGTVGSGPHELIAAGDTLYFTADDGLNGREVWTVRGSSSTAEMLEVRPGSSGSNPNGFVSSGEAVYFQANNGVRGAALWKADYRGVKLMADMTFGAGDSAAMPLGYFAGKGELLFSATNSSDGTEPRVLDLRRPQPVTIGGAQLPVDGKIIEFNGVGYFAAQDPSLVGGGTEIFSISNGVANQETHLNPIQGANPTHLTRVGNFLYFAANDGSFNGNEVWRFDTTVSGGSPTAIDLNAFLPTDPQEIVCAGIAPCSSASEFYFIGYDSSGATKVYKSDGTQSGTIVVSGGYLDPTMLTWASGKMFFLASDAANGKSLWAATGTTAALVINTNTIRPTDGSGISEMVAYGTASDMLVFNAYDGSTKQLWMSDGTTVGTIPLSSVSNSGLQPSELTVLNNGELLLFAGNSSGTGFTRIPYRLDDTGTVVPLTSTCTGPKNFLSNGTLTYFSCKDATASNRGYELYRTNATASNTPSTVLRVDINQAAGASSSPEPLAFIPSTNRLYLSADDGLAGRELLMHRTSGSIIDTSYDLAFGADSSFPENLTKVGTGYAFTTEDAFGVPYLWYSDNL